MGAMPDAASSMFENRLGKNVRHWRKWARAKGLTAFRLYDRDIPEYPYVVDQYADRAHVVEFPSRKARKAQGIETQREEVLDAVSRVLELPRSHLFTKTHEPQPWGQKQYGRKGEGGERLSVEEQGLRFWVNLTDYLDTGLFMDHRLTRARVRGEVKGKRFLNLFAYTGAFTVYAAAGGASQTTSVDLSGTYLDWAEDNLALNKLSGAHHLLVQGDVLAWLAAQQQEPSRFDVIVLDPPSFSTSKRMDKTFNVQRDHPRVLSQVMELLAPKGILYFSTNFLGFSPQFEKLSPRSVEELTPGSIPEDFRRKEIHRCWRFEK